MPARHWKSAALSVLLAIFLCAGAAGQEKERPKLKDFGSSLKRSQSDEKKKPAAKPGAKRTDQTSAPSSDDIDVLKVETSLVTSDVLVLDARGNPVKGLTEKDFLITEDGRPQQVGVLTMGDNVKVPRTIVLIIDYSNSQFPFIGNSIAAAKSLVDKLPPSDRMAIVTDDVEMIQDFTRDKEKLKGKLNSLLDRISGINKGGGRQFGKSQQYSALLATLNEAFINEDQRPIVIFQTDGDQLAYLRNSPLTSDLSAFSYDKKMAERLRKRFEELRVDFSLDDICRAAEKARATIYTVVPGHQLLGRPLAEQIALTRVYYTESSLSFRSVTPEQRAQVEALLTDEKLKPAAENQAKIQGALAAVANSTGGWTMFLEQPDDAERIYSGILDDINHRYLVGYYPTNKEHDGKRRRLEISVRDHPEYNVVGRRWYFAPAAGQ